MQKNKIISIILGMLLIGGGTLAGTKAWLKDQNRVNNDLVITTGSFKLDVEVQDKWQIVESEDTEITNKDDNNEFKNVRPGDQFKKTVTLKNSGSLAQQVTINQPTTLVHTQYMDIVEVKLENIEDINNNILRPDDNDKSFDIVVSTKPNLMENGKHENITIDFNKMISPIIIDSKQVNEK